MWHVIWIRQRTKCEKLEETIFIGVSRKGGILLGAIILFISERKKHNVALNLSPTLAFSPSIDIVFIASLINVIIIFLIHLKEKSLQQA